VIKVLLAREGDPERRKRREKTTANLKRSPPVPEPLLEAMIGEIRKVVQNFLRETGKRSVLQRPWALGTEWSTSWVIPKRLRISPKINKSNAPKASKDKIPNKNRGIIHKNAHGQDISSPHTQRINNYTPAHLIVLCC